MGIESRAATPHDSNIPPLMAALLESARMHHRVDERVTGIVGSAFSWTFTTMGFAARDVEVWLRITSLSVGIIVGLVTIYSVVMGRKRGDK